MKDYIYTDRLILRPFKIEDAKSVTKICNNIKLYENTLNLPHPYTMDDGIEWIKFLIEFKDEERLITLAITDKVSSELLGCISAEISKIHKHAEVGYWLGEEYWNKGIMTEALRALIDYLFNEIKLKRIFGQCIVSNKASGKVMEKAGMKYEGQFPNHLYKNGKFLDINNYGIVKET